MRVVNMRMHCAKDVRYAIAGCEMCHEWIVAFTYILLRIAARVERTYVYVRACIAQRIFHAQILDVRCGYITSGC